MLCCREREKERALQVKAALFQATLSGKAWTAESSTHGHHWLATYQLHVLSMIQAAIVTWTHCSKSQIWKAKSPTGTVMASASSSRVLQG